MSDMVSFQWRDHMVRQLDDLGRWVKDRLVIEPEPGRELIPAERYLDPDYLYEAVILAQFIDQVPSAAAERAAPDLRVAASRFTRQYASAMSAVALAGLARGVGIDVSLSRCTLMLKYNVPVVVMVDTTDQELLRCAERSTTWPADGPVVESLDELRRYVCRKLYSENIEPIFTRLLDLTNVSPKLLWANAAEWVGMVSDAAGEYLTAADAAPFLADRRTLLEAAELPGRPGPNPLHGQLDWVPTGRAEFPWEVQTRRVCCINYQLESRKGRLCQNCSFLPLDDRVALIEERHDVNMGVPGGVAERRSIDVGLAKLEYVRKPG
jgi:ferric iron reductase protein FhuF